MTIFIVVALLLVCRMRYISATQCGTTEFVRKLISRGHATERGEFPFLVAMYLIAEMKFICGGSLISMKHVLTAAHCNRDHGLTLLPEDIFVILGAYDLTLRIEKGAVPLEVIEIRIHPDWNEYSDKLDADLAILVLSKMVTFTNYIRPVCMPPDNAVVANADGTIVGWGLTENGTQPHLKYPKQGITTALSGSYCYTTDYVVAKLSSLRTFCGSGGNSSPNSGDSGGGFFVRYGSAWVQYGIVSAIRSNATGFVDPNSISIYTNVNKFKGWINDTVRQSGGQVGVANVMTNIKIQLKCDYGHQIGTKLYGCFLENLYIRSENVEVASFTGSHQKEKSDVDVKLLRFGKGTAISLPDDIGNIFKNLMSVEILSDLKTMLIRRSNFRNLSSLDSLYIKGNDIETIGEDCFWDLPELNSVVITNNKLRNLDGSLFVNNSNLREVYLYENQLDFIPENLFGNNSLLQIVSLYKNNLKSIHEKTFANNGKLTNVDVAINQLESISVKLFQNNLLLEVVRLQTNSLKSIHEKTFDNNAKLVEVSLSANQLVVIPKNLFKNNLLLEIVFLSQNNLKTIDEETFAHNVKLSKVYLHENQLDFVPGNLFGSNLLLQIVALNRNNLKTIHQASFVNNHNLKEVYLQGNQLDSIPGSLFANNLLLEKINFSDNNLKIIDIDFTGFKNIKIVDFSNNLCISSSVYIESEDKSLIDLQGEIRTNCSSVKP